MNTINNGLFNKITQSKIDNGAKLDKMLPNASHLKRKAQEKCELDRLLQVVKTSPVQIASKQKLEQYKTDIMSEHYNPNIPLLIARLSDELLAEGILDD